LGVEHLTLRPAKETRHQFSVLNIRICLNVLPTTLNQYDQWLAVIAYSVPPSQLQMVQEY